MDGPLYCVSFEAMQHRCLLNNINFVSGSCREAQAMEGPQGREATKAGMGERALLVR